MEPLPKMAVEDGVPNLKQKLGALLFDHLSGDRGIHSGPS
jgi:hypothetical protein